MMLCSWEELPEQMKNESVGYYYDLLQKRKLTLIVKRLFDVAVASLMLVILSPLFFILAIWIKLDSPGGVLFRQVRVTQYCKEFRIFKFRTMVENAEQVGSQVTTKNDMRVTNAGRFLRKCRLDEIPQLLNIISGDMSFVGTRPEVVKYVERYTDEMYATLLLPAGVTSLASIQFKDEEKILSDLENVDEVYVGRVLPHKMQYNLQEIKQFSFWKEFKIMIWTVLAVVGIHITVKMEVPV